MAGSDLDGDEYLVMWDEELFLDWNEPAADYSPPKMVSPVPNDPARMQENMADAFANYMANDSIGKIANNYLANADLFGLDSQVEIFWQLAFKFFCFLGVQVYLPQVPTGRRLP